MNGLFELYMGGCFRNEGVIAGWWLSVTSVLQALRDLQHGSDRSDGNSDRGKQIDRRENIDGDKIVDQKSVLHVAIEPFLDVCGTDQPFTAQQCGWQKFLRVRGV